MKTISIINKNTSAPNCPRVDRGWEKNALYNFDLDIGHFDLTLTFVTLTMEFKIDLFTFDLIDSYDNIQIKLSLTSISSCDC